MTLLPPAPLSWPSECRGSDDELFEQLSQALSSIAIENKDLKEAVRSMDEGVIQMRALLEEASGVDVDGSVDDGEVKGKRGRSVASMDDVRPRKQPSEDKSALLEPQSIDDLQRLLSAERVAREAYQRRVEENSLEIARLQRRYAELSRHLCEAKARCAAASDVPRRVRSSCGAPRSRFYDDGPACVAMPDARGRPKEASRVV